MKKLTTEEVHTRLAPRGITLLEPYTGSSQRGTFRCANGHEWQAVVNQVLHGYGCRVCSGLVPYTKESINEKIEARGLELIGDFSRAGNKTEFRCSEGHTWSTVPHHVIHGTGCPHCFKSKRRSKSSILEQVAPRGIRVVGNFDRVTDETEFECEHGHRWVAKLSTVLYGSSGCPQCSGRVPITKEIVNERIAHRGLELIGEYTASSHKTTFRCSSGHEWEARPEKILRDRGCPYCAGTIPLTKDMINERLTDRSIVALTEHIPNEKTRFRCPEGHEWETLAYSVLGGSGCPHCSGSAPLTKEIVNERIADRGIELIGEYISTQAYATFRCPEGHEWDATPTNVMGGNGCPDCAPNTPLSKEIVNDRIVDRGIKLIGNFLNSTTKTRFRCSEGHEWDTAPANILSGSGCPECSGRASDNDTIYIWRAIGARHHGKPVYKVGITSARLGEKRIKQVARKHEVGYEVVIIAETRLPAMDIEAEIKKIGDDPQYIGDGATEFRAMSDKELRKALNLIDLVQTKVLYTQLSLL